MRVHTPEEARAGRFGQEHQSSADSNVPGRQQRRSTRQGAAKVDRTPRASRQTPTFVLPAAAGLALPRLSGIPTTFEIDNEQAETAMLALKLLEHGLVEEGDADGTRPVEVLKNALSRSLGDGLKRKDLELEFRLIRVAEHGRYYLLVFIEGAAVLSFDRAAAMFDALDPQLGPSILSHVYRHLVLSPAFTPEVAKDYIRCYVWHGEDDDTALLEMAREELEHQSNGVGRASTEEDVVAYASEHFLTVANVNERLDLRYQENGTLSLRACARRCKQHGLHQALPAIEALERLGELQGALPEPDREIYDLIEGEMPFGLIVTLGGDNDLVREMYGEHEQMIWQGGMDFQPSYALAFDPNDPDSLGRLKDALVVCREVLQETNTLLNHLEVLGCL